MRQVDEIPTQVQNVYACRSCHHCPLEVRARGNKYIVTLVDYFSKWPEAEAMADKSANSVALFLYKMICR